MNQRDWFDLVAFAHEAGAPDPEDAVQAALLKIHIAYSNIDEAGWAEHFMAHTARRVVLTFVKKQVARQQHHPEPVDWTFAGGHLPVEDLAVALADR